MDNDFFKREPIKLSDSTKRFLVMFNFAIVMCFVYAMAEHSNSPITIAARSAQETQREENNYKELAIIQAQDAIRNRLKDPGSVQFRNVGFHRNKKNSDAVCGEVNARNSLGGYAGFEPFLATGNGIAILQADMKANEFRKLWKARCMD